MNYILGQNLIFAWLFKDDGVMITSYGESEEEKQKLNDNLESRDGKRERERDIIGMVITRKTIPSLREREREERTNTRNDDERQVVSVFAPLYKLKIISVFYIFCRHLFDYSFPFFFFRQIFFFSLTNKFINFNKN